MQSTLRAPAVRYALIVRSSAFHARAFPLQRSFSTSLPVLAPMLKAGEGAGRGAEGLHPKDEQPFQAVTHPRGSPKREEGDKLPSLTGDWVLFHPVYTAEETASVQVLEHKAKTVSDRLAGVFVRLLRFGFDLLSGYRHKELPPNHNMSLQELRAKGYSMDEHRWLLRLIFLETLAGVPGMVAATLRHLRSLRLMKRDAGWIHTLLEESENERMHLMTFMTLRKPSIWFRGLVLGAQGVFYNAFFIAYLLSPRTAHRFVGKLEEEAVLTYTRLIEDIEQGRLPEWENKPAPAIAIDYWRLGNDASLLDVIRAVRADEATHRFVNHSLANLNQGEDVNPFALREPDMKLKGTKIGLERSEAAEFVRETRQAIDSKSPSASLEKPTL
ncbi:hypothetical protein FRB99_006612 [Tulasnella sp. 403]|nr:hypothetical protein FRB99_006612 [Tulasnella sp. 403]